MRDHAFTIVGVMPPDFEYPRGVELWATRTGLADTEANPAFRTGLLRDVELLVRLRPGGTREQAAAELGGIMTRLEAEAAPGRPRGFRPVIMA